MGGLVERLRNQLNRRRTANEYFDLYKSKKPTVKRLDEKTIKYAINKRREGVSASEIATALGISERHVRRLYARFLKTGKYPIPNVGGRPTKPVTQEEITTVLEVHKKEPVGVLRTASTVQLESSISHRRIYRILKDNKLVTPAPAKSRKRKWVRFERKYSNAMWHVDWHIMKESRFKGLNLITYLDDASRCIMGANLFEESTSTNAVIALCQAVNDFETPASILSDNGSCFVGVRSKNPKGKWQPTLFENELLSRNIQLITTRPRHPQTNGKLERFHHTIETEIWHYESLPEYIKYYNERRLHFSLDFANRQTPLMAFQSRLASTEIRESDPKWMERDADD